MDNNKAYIEISKWLVRNKIDSVEEADEHIEKLNELTKECSHNVPELVNYFFHDNENWDTYQEFIESLL